MSNIFENCKFGYYAVTKNDTIGIYWGKSVAFVSPIVGGDYPYHIIFPNGMGMYNEEGKFCADNSEYDIEKILINELVDAEAEVVNDLRKEIMTSYENGSKEIINKIFAIANNTIGIEIDPNAYKRYNEND